MERLASLESLRGLPLGLAANVSHGVERVDGFGKTLRQYRKHRRMTQTQLAAAVGVAPAYVSQIESSLRVPSLRVAHKIAEVLHVELPALLGTPGYSPSRERLSDVEKLELLQSLIRGVERDLEARPVHEDLEAYPGAAAARVSSSPEVAVRTYSFRGLTPPAHAFAHLGNETVYCACGRAWLRVDSREHALAAGEQLTFDASRPHVMFGAEGTVVVSTASPPPTTETLQLVPMEEGSEAGLPSGAQPGAPAD